MGDNAAPSCAHDSGGLGRGARADTGHGPWLPLPALSAVAHQGCSVRALMHAPPRLALGSGLNACNASRDDPVCCAFWQMLRLLANVLANWHRSRCLPAQPCNYGGRRPSWTGSSVIEADSPRGGQRTHKMTRAVYQQILAAALQQALSESDH